MFRQVAIICAAIIASAGADARQSRSQASRQAFVKSNPCPATGERRLPCPG